jgi:hypothetical protein
MRKRGGDDKSMSPQQRKILRPGTVSNLEWALNNALHACSRMLQERDGGWTVFIVATKKNCISTELESVHRSGTWMIKDESERALYLNLITRLVDTPGIGDEDSKRLVGLVFASMYEEEHRMYDKMLDDRQRLGIPVLITAIGKNEMVTAMKKLNIRSFRVH